jgi:hypothetical protein
MSAASLLCCLTGSGPSARRPDARGASADAPATRHVQCRDIIVHPQFVQTLSFPPVEFCPMDWLPDEVITNVLVHVVRGLATTRRASVRATRRDGAGVGGPCRILAPKALTPARVFSCSVPLADTLRVLSKISPQTGVDAARFAAVSRRARRLASDDSLWRELFERRFRFEVPPDVSPPACAGGWRGVYRHHQTTLDRIVRGEARDARDAFSSFGFANVGAGRVGAVHVFHGGSLLVSS